MDIKKLCFTTKPCGYKFKNTNLVENTMSCLISSFTIFCVMRRKVANYLQLPTVACTLTLSFNWHTAHPSETFRKSEKMHNNN